MFGGKMKFEVKLNDLLKIYEKEISKNVKNKRKVLNFEINKMQNISNIKEMLEHNEVGHNKYNIFLIYEPKRRLVMSLSVKDKIINHYITRHILEAKLTKYLDMRNCATRKNMGTDYGVKLIKKYLVALKNKYNNFYILKIDISKYFYNIDHNILKNMLKNKLEDEEYELIAKIIDSTNKAYINEIIKRFQAKYGFDIPLYAYGKGLPIGNMTSQFLSIFYLNKLDHFIVHNLKCKYYVRYMDDFIIMHYDLNYLKKVKEIIIKKLKQEYLLKVNDKKTMIVKSNQAFSFLGYTYRILNNKVIMKIRKSNYEKIKKKIKALRKALDSKTVNFNQAFCSIMTYMYSYKYANNIRIKNIIDRYFYCEK